MFTNIADPFSSNVCPNTLPDELKTAPRFEIDNPIALQKQYLKLKSNKRMKNMSEIRKMVEAGEQSALEVLANVFDWLDGLDSQPMMKITHPHKKRRNLVSKITNLNT